METITPSGRTPVGTISATGVRPTLATDGVVSSALYAGQLATANMLLYIEGNGSGQTLDKPAGGQGGPELWGYRLAGDGATRKWWLIGFLNKGTIAQVPASGGWVEQVLAGAGPIFDRLCVVGIPAAATAMTYYFEALERFIG